MRTTSPEVLVELDRSRPRSLRAQVEAELRDAIRSGRLTAGTPVPSSRALAADLGVTRGVVVAAYDQLIAEGYLLARPGSGTVINEVPEATTRRPVASPSEAPLVADFTRALPDLDLFPRTAWLRATRASMQSLPSAQLGYVDRRGLPQLRAALADHLARVRGVCADPDRILVCGGFGHGFGLVAGALLATGRRDFAVEDPGYAGPREHLDAVGGRYRGVPVDAEGIVVEALARTPARAVVVTPAHQAPTGAVLSSARRSALIAWAGDVDGYVIEDDYDAEYRYDRHPVGALQGLAPERVVYCGTTSKSVAPGLRLGWLVLPEDLVEPTLARRFVADEFTSSLLQAACATFLANGDLDRHLRRSRRVYRERRDALIAALARWFPEAVPSGASAGLHVLVTLPPSFDELAVVAGALAAGVKVHPLDEYRTAKPTGRAPGLVLRYGTVPPEQADAGVRVLADAARASGGA